MPLSSWRDGGRTSAQRPAHETLGERLQRGLALVRALDQPGAPEDHHRAVVHRVVKRRPGEHEPVDQRDRPGRRGCRRRASVDHPRGRRAVEVDLVAAAGVQRRDDVGLAVDGEAEVGDQRLVEDRVDRRAVVVGAGGDPADTGAFGGAEEAMTGNEHGRFGPLTRTNTLTSWGQVDLHLDLGSAPGRTLRAAPSTRCARPSAAAASRRAPPPATRAGRPARGLARRGRRGLLQLRRRGLPRHPPRRRHPRRRAPSATVGPHAHQRAHAHQRRRGTTEPR